MSIKIKNMSLPDSCVVCPLCLLHEHGNERFCYVTRRTIDISFDSYTRQDECPIEEVEE